MLFLLQCVAVFLAASIVGFVAVQLKKIENIRK